MVASCVHRNPCQAGNRVPDPPKTGRTGSFRFVISALAIHFNSLLHEFWKAAGSGLRAAVSRELNHSYASASHVRESEEDINPKSILLALKGKPAGRRALASYGCSDSTTCDPH